MADLDAKEGADSSAFLEDMLHESGMAGWVQQLGLKGQEQFAACALYEESDPVLNLHYGVGNAEAGNAASTRSIDALSSRIRNRSPSDEAGPERRRARTLSFATESEREDELEAAGQGNGEDSSVGADSKAAAVEATGGSGYTTRSRGGAAGTDEGKDAAGARSERLRGKREEEGEHKGLAVLTAAAKWLELDAGVALDGCGGVVLTAWCVGSRAEEKEDGAWPHTSPGGAGHVPSTPSQTPGPRRDKGLRSFSLKVCQKVEERDVTTYNQVADELVSEFRLDESMAFDEKNIRRRIYDALNVLMAMDIITKDKKHIKWKGFPQSWEKEREGLERRVDEATRQVARKRKEVEKKALQYISLCNVIRRNAAILEQEKARGEAGGGEGEGEQRRIRIPFVIVKTTPTNEINLELAADEQEALLNCNASFELHDDVAILEHMNMAQVASEEDLRSLLRSCPEVAKLLLERIPTVVRSK